jgi:hypothetical protein
MKNRLITGVVVMVAVLVALPGLASDEETDQSLECRVEGTWFGENSSGFIAVFRIEKNAGGTYTIIADGLATGDCTALHGELTRISHRTVLFRQISYCLEYGMAFLGAFEGTLELADCDHLEAVIPTSGAYYWPTTSIPFVDPFDIDFSDPGNPTTGTFTRMPSP